MAYSTHRPRGFEGRGDQHLPKVAKELRQALSRIQNDLAFDTLRLPSKALTELAGILVDFAEDIHNDIGIWAAYERYNVEFFGTALPLTISTSSEGVTGLHPDRLRHLLWILYPTFIDGLILSPTHQDLEEMADFISAFFINAFKAIPKDSGVKKFLQSPNEFGWDVKRKLVWLGSRSYLLRTCFSNYMAEEADDAGDIGHTDDFICQECTPWSGLGAIDILAGALDITDDDRQSLRSWYERHAAFYKLLTVSNETLEALNIINDQRYTIRINMDNHPFKPGQLIFGSLVPWRGEWFWSGEQQLWGDASEIDLDDLKRTMRRESSNTVCRYSKEYEAQVRRHASDFHEATMRFYGKDLIVYPDGLSMAADWQKEIREQWNSKPQDQVKQVMEEHGLKKGRPEMKIPKDLLKHKNGIGVFINPDEGKEIVQDFTLLVSGLNRKGESLTEDEQDTIRGFFEADAVSPRFVRRLLEEYGDESVRAAFLLKGDLPGYWLDYLLRSRKGHFYRKRYPSVSVI